MYAPHVVTLIGYFAIPPGNAKSSCDKCAKMVAQRDKEPCHLAPAHSFGADGTAVSREDYDSADAPLESRRT